jgi:transcriptional regulator with XRE-family HTH domain
MTITGAEVKAARELLGWTQAELAGKVRVRVTAISKFEQGGPRPRLLALSGMRFALEGAGAEFASDGSGVKLRAGNDHLGCPDHARR